MTGPAILQRRLFRTKEAANYLAMSEWKLRRLIQDGSVPHIQDQEGGPFLLDLNDLDNYIESRKSTGEHDLVPHKASVATTGRRVELDQHRRRI
jgi:excisionase family DNA binding protein